MAPNECTGAENILFDEASAAETSGLRKVCTARPGAGGLRFSPTRTRGSIADVTRWRDGYAWAPTTPTLAAESPLCIEGHIRLEHPFWTPEGRFGTAPVLHLPPTGRYSDVAAPTRKGGECQFFPIVASGANALEAPGWALGVGVPVPEGSYLGAGVERVVPMLLWWDNTEKRMRVAAGGGTVLWGKAHHVAVELGGAPTFYLDGAAVATISGYGLSVLPASVPACSAPFYFGRCWTREPGIKYDTQHDRKHAYMGRTGIVPTAVGATTLRFSGAQLAFAAGTVNSYVGYRVRVVSRTPTDDAEVGRIYRVVSTANPTVDTGGGSITFTLEAAHAITTAHTVDIVPQAEPMPLAATIQEVRLWRSVQGATAVALRASRRLYHDWRADRVDSKLIDSDGSNLIPSRLLLAYWPFDEDGGSVCRERIAGAHALLAPSVLAGESSVTQHEIWLDGQQTALQADLRDDPNFVRNWRRNLGADFTGYSEWHLCARVNFCVAGLPEATAAGNLQDHLYQTLFSLGAPGKAPAIEFRLTNFGGNGLHIYCWRPDGVATAIPYTLTPGRWYDAIVGIEAVATNASDPQEHYAYFQFFDATGAAAGGLAGAASAAFSLKRVPLDPAAAYVASFGASVAGTATQGAQRNNPSAIGLRAAGLGFMQVHFPATGAPSMTDAKQLSPAVRFGAMKTDDLSPVVTGAESGVALTLGAARITVDTGTTLPTNLRRVMVVSGAALLARKRDGAADEETPDTFIVRAASGVNLDVHRAHDQATVRGAALRLLPWVVYTDLRTSEPQADIDLNAGREAGSTWAWTKGALANLAPTLVEWAVAVDPAYEFASPLRVAPEWGANVVDQLLAPVAALKETRLRTGDLVRAGVVGGSLYDFDSRWRRGGPYGDEDYSYQVRPMAPWRAARFRAETAGGARCVRMDAPDSPSGIEIPAQAFAPSTGGWEGWRAQLWFDDLEGRQTIVFGGNIDATGATPKVFCELWVRLDQRKLVIEVRQGADALVGITTNEPPLRAGVWVEITAALRSSGGDPSDVLEFLISVDGAAQPLTTVAIGAVMVTGRTGATTWWGCAVANGVAFDPLHGRIGAVARLSANESWDPAGGAYDPIELDPDVGTEGYVYVVNLKDGGEHFRDVRGPADDGVGVLTVHAPPVPLGHGMGRHADVRPSIEAFNGTAYVSTLATRPWRYDGSDFTPVGIAPPAARLSSVAPLRTSARVRDAGADLPLLVGLANRADLNAVAPNLRTFVGSTPTPVQGDMGALVYVPSDPDMGGAGNWPCGYIATVAAVQATGYTLIPGPFAEHLIAGAGECAWMLFRNGGGGAVSSVLAAVQRLTASTPWGARRLLCDGKDNVSAPQSEALAEGVTNEGALRFAGGTMWTSAPWQPSAGAPARGMVLDFKCYLRPDTIPGDGEEQVLHERALDGDTGSWRVVIFKGGRVRFEFFDSALGAMRSIATVGKVLSVGQWHYLRLRYRFKQSGSWHHDTAGGWEPDLRWTRRAGTIDAALNNFRDGLWVYACEGLHKRDTLGFYAHQDVASGYYGDVDDAPECPLLSLPGCESQVNGLVANGAASTHNHSQHLLNVGLLQSAPYITPQAGDSLFPAAGVNAASPQNGIIGTLRLNTIGPLYSGGAPQVGATAACQWTLPAGFVLPRSCSMNRDDAWNRESDAGSGDESTQIAIKSAGTVRQSCFNDTHPAYPATDVGRTPNMASPAVFSGGQVYGRFTAWGVLVRVWTMVANGGGAGAPGSFPDGASAGVPRVLVIVHLNETDLGASSIGGVAGHRIFVTDDALYGGDGLGSLKVGAVACAAGSTWHITIELPNGLNQASTSPNRNVCPALLEQGANPVGLNDAPDQSLAPIRFGGTEKQNNPGVVASGFKGSIDDAGFLLTALASHASNVYTADCLAPDAFFTGPKDTRFQSLPRLNFGTNALVLDIASGTPAAAATAAYRFDEQSGLTAAKDATLSSVEAPALTFVRQGAQIALAGRHRFRATYYDPQQDVESNPGPEFSAALAGSGDALDAAVGFALEGLPVSGDRRRSLIRRIYKSLPDSAVLTLYAEVGDNATTGLVPLTNDVRLVAERQLEFDNGRPPYCRAMRAGEEVMGYAGIDDAPDAVVLSKAFKPEEVPGTRLVTCESGRGGPVTAMGLLRGLFVAGKKHALFVITPGDPPRVERVGGTDGFLGAAGIAEFDGSLLALAAGGVVAYTGNQTARIVSDLVRDLYRSGLNATLLPQGAASAWEDRGLWVAALGRQADREPRLLLAAEARRDGDGNRIFAFSNLLPGVGVSALAATDTDSGGVSGLLVGTDLGAVLEADRGATVGADRASFCSGTVTGVVGYLVTFENGSTRVPVAVEFDGATLLVVEELSSAGVAVAIGTGVRFRTVAATEVVTHDRNNILAGVISLYVRDRVANPAINHVAIVGGRTWSWTSPRIMFTPENLKAAQYLDLEFAPVDGTVYLAFFVGQQDTATFYARITLERGAFSVPLTNVRAHFFRFSLSGYGHGSGFELLSWGLRTTASPQSAHELKP